MKADGDDDKQKEEEGDQQQPEKSKKQRKQSLTVEEEKQLHEERLKEIVKKISTSHIFTRSEIMEILLGKARALGKTFDDRLMVGTVGYPNVGKSSVINVICQKKRVGVANMPGKTKHF